MRRTHLREYDERAPAVERKVEEQHESRRSRFPPQDAIHRRHAEELKRRFVEPVRLKKGRGRDDPKPLDEGENRHDEHRVKNGEAHASRHKREHEEDADEPKCGDGIVKIADLQKTGRRGHQKPPFRKGREDQHEPDAARKPAFDARRHDGAHQIPAEVPCAEARPVQSPEGEQSEEQDGRRRCSYGEQGTPVQPMRNHG